MSFWACVPVHGSCSTHETSVYMGLRQHRRRLGLVDIGLRDTGLLHGVAGIGYFKL